MFNLIQKQNMFNQKILMSLILSTGLIGFGAEAKYFEYGAFAFLVLILLWYGRNSMKDDKEREKTKREDDKELLKRHEQEKATLRAEAERERVRNYELSNNILDYLKQKK